MVYITDEIQTAIDAVRTSLARLDQLIKESPGEQTDSGNFKGQLEITITESKKLHDDFVKMVLATWPPNLETKLFEALQGLMAVQPSEPPVWDSLNWEKAVDTARDALDEYCKYHPEKADKVAESVAPAENVCNKGRT